MDDQQAANLQAEVTSLKANVHELELEQARMRKVLMVAWSPPWKKLWWWFRYRWPMWEYVPERAPAKRWPWTPRDYDRGW